MSEHAHPIHELIVVVSGRMTVQAGTTRIAAATGDVLWYAAGQAHAERADPTDPVESFFIGIAWPGHGADWPVLRRDRRGLIRQLAAWLYADRDEASPEAAESRAGLTRALLAEAASLASRSEAEDDLVARIRSVIREQLDGRIALGDLAQAAGLSRSYFVRHYKTLTGRTPMDEVRHLRLERARDLLLGTDLTLREIAGRCGLGSEQLLSRLFRRRYGTTPGAFRVSRSAAGPGGRAGRPAPPRGAAR